MTMPRNTRQRGLSTRPMIVAISLVIAFGGVLFPLMGWIAGIAMMWVSPVWTRGEKALTTLVPIAAAGACLGAIAVVDGFTGWHMLLVLALIPVPLGIRLLVVGMRRADLAER